MQKIINQFQTAWLSGAREAAWGHIDPRAAEIWSLAVFQPQGSIITDSGGTCIDMCLCTYVYLHTHRCMASICILWYQ